MLPKDKRKFAFWGLAATLALSLCVVGSMSENASLFRGAGTDPLSCGSISFGKNTTTNGNTALSTSTSLTTLCQIDGFGSNTVSVTTATKTYCYLPNTSWAFADSYAIRMGTSGNVGVVTFTFGSAITIQSADVYTSVYDSVATLSASTDNETASAQSVPSTTPTLVDPGTGTAKSSGVLTFSLTSTATTSTFTLTTGTSDSSTKYRSYIHKIVFCFSGSGSSESSAASSAASSATSSSASESTSTSSSSSSTPTTTGTYKLVTKSSDIAVGGIYVVGNSKSSSGIFVGNTITSNYYLSPVTLTINSDSTVTPSDATQSFTLGGSSGAYTFGIDSTNDLSSNSTYNGTLIPGTSVNTWNVAFDSSTSAVTIQNVTTSYYLAYGSTYGDWTCVSASTSLYLYVKIGSVGQGLTISSSSLSLTKDSTDTSLTLTPTGFSGTPTYSVVAANTSICSGSVSGTTLSIVGLAAGTTKVTITATYGTDETASVSLDVIVSNASGSYVSIDNTSLTLYVGWDNGTIQASSHNFSGTVTYSVASSSSSATVTINSSTGLTTVTPVSIGSATITITASNGDESAMATCAVTVSAAPTPTLTLSTTSLSIVNGSYGTITATAENFGGTATITASSSNTAAATVAVSSTLVTVTGKAVGTATVTVTAAYSTRSKTATCAVSVINTDATTTEATTWRVAPQTSSTSTANVYSVSYSNGMYRGTVAKTLTKNTEYTTYEDVASYYQAFKGYPSNYVAKASCTYTGNQRCISTYTRATTDNSGYLANLGTRNGSSYIELDIAEAGSTSYKSSSTRGTIRVVVFPDGLQDYGSDTVAIYTSNHYSTFIEYYNCYNHWSALFNGEGTGGASSRPVPTTIKFLAS